MAEHDPVECPAHYQGAGGLQAIDVIEDWGLGYALGCAAKYLLRAARKGDELQDLRKARWYLRRAAASSAAPASPAPRQIGIEIVATAFDLDDARRDILDGLRLASLEGDAQEAREVIQTVALFYLDSHIEWIEEGRPS